MKPDRTLAGPDWGAQVTPTTATLLTLVGERLDQMYGTWTLTDGH
jgi:hypothetical protein